MKDVKVTDSILYIGVDDKDIDLFEGQYIVPKGISYNSYVIMDEKIAVMDTVDARKTEDWFENLKVTLNGKKADYLVVSHMEPDHAANIKNLVELFPEIKIVGNVKTFQLISQFFDIDLTDRSVIVKEGEVLNLGQHKLQFFMAPMVHWPEVMITYDQTEKVLFTADAFGKFSTLDVDEEWDCEARRYYFNIVGKYGTTVQALLKKVENLDVSMICPLHGPVLKENLEYYINKYNIWSSYSPENKGVFIAYASIYGNTAAAAKKLASILKEKEVEKVVLCDLAREDMAEALEDAFRYDRMVVASSTYDGGIFPWMEEFLLHLKSKNYQKRTVGIIENGSWAPMSGKLMKEIIGGFKDVTVCEPIVSIKSTMNDENVKMLESLADALSAE